MTYEALTGEFHIHDLYCHEKMKKKKWKEIEVSFILGALFPFDFVFFANLFIGTSI